MKKPDTPTVNWRTAEKKVWLTDVMYAVGYLMLTITIGVYFICTHASMDALYLILAMCCAVASLMMELWIAINIPCIPWLPIAITYPPNLAAKILLALDMLFTLLFVLENI